MNLKKIINKVIPTKEQWKQSSIFSKVGYIGFWFAIFSLPVSIHFYCSLFITFVNRNPELLETKPFIIINEREDLKFFEENYTPTELGIFFVVHLENGSEHFTINGLKIKSSKYYLSPNQYLSLSNQHQGKVIDEIATEYQERKPYIIIDWDAYLSEKNTKNTLYPNDEAYIGFTLLDPIISGQSESGWEIPTEKYIGYENPPKKPEMIRKYPNFSLLFSDFDINNLPPKTINENLEFFILINDKETPIDKENIHFVDKIKRQQYDMDSFEKMFLRRYIEEKIPY